MTELVHVPDGAVTQQRPMLAPATMEDAWRVAGHLCRTQFVPAGFRGNQAATFAASVWASEVGVGIIQALNGVHVIDGAVSVKPEMMRALIRRGGHRMDITEWTTERCVIHGRRADTGEEATVEFTMDDARAAGLAGKGAWRTYQRDMLLARATARIGRALFSDEIAGLSYTPDEVAMVQGAPMDDAIIDATVAHADVDVDGGEVTAGGDLMTLPTSRRLFAILRDAGITDEARHGWATGILHRTVTTFADLTELEARTLCSAGQHPATVGPIVDADIIEFPDPDTATDAWRAELQALIDAGRRPQFVAWCRARKVSNNVTALSSDLVRDALLHIGDDLS